MRLAILTFALCTLAGSAFAAGADTSGADKLGWKLTLQSWSANYNANGSSVEKSIDYAKQLGIHYLEVYPGQQLGFGLKSGWGPGMSDAEIQKCLDAAKAADIKIIDTGVIGIPNREDEARKFFDWAKKVGLTEIVSEPEEKYLPMIDKVAGDYDIKVALHDHPKPSRYWDPEHTYDSIKDLKHVGFCADVGHWKRSGFEPSIVLEKYGERVYSLHFKDLVKEGNGYHDVPWGTGESKAKAMLQALKDKGFKGPIAIEYEYKWDLPTLQKCVDFFNEQANELAK
jgi:sugar phosphate isomerase/epimerase